MFPPNETEQAELESALGAEYDENETRNTILEKLPLSKAQLSEAGAKLTTGNKSLEDVTELISPGISSRPFRMPTDREDFLDACTTLAGAPLTLGNSWQLGFHKSRRYKNEESTDSKMKTINEHLATIKQSREELLPIARRVDISVNSAEDYTALTESLTPWAEHLGIETVESQTERVDEPSEGETEGEEIPLPPAFEMSIEDPLTDSEAKFSALTEFLTPWKKYVESVESAKTAETAETVKSVGSVETTE